MTSTPTTPPHAPALSRSVEVAAPPERVWDLVSDLPGMGRFSPEATGGRWTRGGGPVVGARFRGSNSRGGRRWSTVATVTQAERGRAFAFVVSSVGQPVSRWAYALEPVPGGCRVTETWEDRRTPWFRVVAELVTGTRDRGEFTARSLEQTLAGVKAAAEAG